MAIDGEGNPENTTINEYMKWLYSIAHLVKPLVKKRMGKNFIEPPVECLFWADKEKDFISGNKDKWKWRVMVVLIDWITQEQFNAAVTEVEGKRGPAPKTLRLESLCEGKSVQIMHIGDYRAVEKIREKPYREFLPKNNLKPNGYYHEIYPYP